MRNNITRQSQRRTLKVCPGFNNNTVFQAFSANCVKQLRKPEVLLRLRGGRAIGLIEEVALALFQALKERKFAIATLRTGSPEEEQVKRIFHESSVAGYKVRGVTFRRQISGDNDASYVLSRIKKPAGKKGCNRVRRFQDLPDRSDTGMVPSLGGIGLRAPVVRDGMVDWEQTGLEA